MTNNEKQGTLKFRARTDGIELEGSNIKLEGKAFGFLRTESTSETQHAMILTLNSGDIVKADQLNKIFQAMHFHSKNNVTKNVRVRIQVKQANRSSPVVTTSLVQD